MANTSIYTAIERLWQHIIAKLGEKADAEALAAHIDESNPHNVTIEQIGAEASGTAAAAVAAHNEATNAHQSLFDAKMDRSGGTMEGALTAQNNTDYSTKQVRNIYLIAEGEEIPAGANGDICLVYTP